MHQLPVVHTLRVYQPPRGRSALPLSTSPLLGVLALLVVMCVGCGKSDSQNGAGTNQPPAVPPVARVGSEPGPAAASRARRQDLDDDPEEPLASDDEIAFESPQEGTPEWLIREITRLRIALEVPVGGANNETETNAADAAQKQEERELQQKKIIELATQVIAKTHAHPEQEQLFNNAVHYLTDTRMQMALGGNQEQAQLLNDDADALFERDATSFAAVEAATKVLQLMQQQAARHAEQDPRWAEAFARQARLFAEKFPRESSRAAVNLLASSRICETVGLLDDARACLVVVEEKFTGTPYADQAAPTLRRMRLAGQLLSEFGGSTHDGGFITADQFRGRTLLIAFWASNSATFRDQLPAIRAAQEKYGERLAVLGVNMDRDEIAIDRFLEETGIGWKHIFFSDPEKRGLRNVVARYYGVTRVPTFWLVDAQGVVRSVDLNVSQLDAELHQLAAGASNAQRR